METNQIGDAVYSCGVTDGIYSVDRADSSNSSKMPLIGVIIEKYGDTSCLVQLSGELKNVYTGLVPSKIYWIGSDGRPCLFQNLPSLAPTDLSYGQSFGVSLGANVLLLKPGDNIIVRRG